MGSPDTVTVLVGGVTQWNYYEYKDGVIQAHSFLIRFDKNGEHGAVGTSTPDYLLEPVKPWVLNPRVIEAMSPEKLVDPYGKKTHPEKTKAFIDEKDEVQENVEE